MDKKKRNKFLGIAAVIFSAFALSSCNSFCSEADTANYMFGYDGLNTRFFENESDGIDYILDTFATKTEGFNEASRSKSNLSVSFYSETENKYVSIKCANDETAFNDAVFNTFNSNLKTIKPVKIELINGIIDSSTNATKNTSYVFGFSEFTSNLISTASSNGISVPSFSYFNFLENKVIDAVINNATSITGYFKGKTKESLTYQDVYGYTYEDYKEFKKDTTNEVLLNKMLNGEGEKNSITYLGRNRSLFANFGSTKFYSESDANDRFVNIKKRNDEIVKNNVKSDEGMSDKYLTLYENTLSQKVAQVKTCITMDDGFYGHVNNDPLNDTVLIQGKGKDFYQGWGEAFTKHGFLEGLFVYPISALVENLSHAFGMNGGGQILAVILTTLIVRILFLLITLPSTISQQKMSFLQPEIAKLQQKYPNANTNQYEKQKLASAQMALYKKNKVHPFASMLVIVIQFPVFISVWNALTGSASLSRDAVLGLRLSDTIWGALTSVSGWPANPGWWTALVLILLMSAAQICSMLIPNWLNKKRMKTITKTGNSAATNETNKTMKYTQWAMTIMIVFMGFNLPSAMGVYWLMGALISILQSVLLHIIFMEKSKKNSDRKGA